MERWDSPEARQQFVNTARLYRALLSQHIQKEDNVLFALAENVLNAQDDASLTERFDTHEREHMGEGVHEQYHQPIHDLEAEFL